MKFKVVVEYSGTMDIDNQDYASDIKDTDEDRVRAEMELLDHDWSDYLKELSKSPDFSRTAKINVVKEVPPNSPEQMQTRISELEEENRGLKRKLSEAWLDLVKDTGRVTA